MCATVLFVMQLCTGVLLTFLDKKDIYLEEKKAAVCGCYSVLKPRYF